MNSPEEFAAWYADTENRLFSKYDLMYKGICLLAQCDVLGWWMSIRIDRLSMINQILRITRTLYDAEVPVALSSALKLIEMAEESDFVGMQSTRHYHYDTIYDDELGSYVSLGNDKDPEVIAKTLWEPILEIAIV